MTMNKNMKLWKYSGTFLVITGVIHTVYALLLGKEDFTDMIKDGLINSTDDSYSRAFALWFLVCGIILRDIPKIIKFKATNSLRVSCLFCIFKHSPQKTV